MANLDLSKYGITGVKKIYHNPRTKSFSKQKPTPACKAMKKGK